MSTRKVRGLLLAAVLVVAALAAYHFLWPSYSWQRHIDPEDVLMAAIPEVRENYEVRRETDPALLKRLIRALNGGREKFVQIKLAVGGVLVLHRRRGPSVLIRYGRAGPGGPMLFREPPTASRPGSMKLYRSAALGRALEAIRSSKSCVARRPSIPPRSVGRINLYAPGAARAVPVSGPEAGRIVGALNAFLRSVDTSFYALLEDPMRCSFYAGEVDPRAHLGATTAALVTLDSPLTMHTTMMFWGTESGPPAEYQEFETATILISDALSVDGEKVVAFSSNARPNRFYLVDADGHPRYPSYAKEVIPRWNEIIRAIQEAVAAGSGVSPQARELKLNR